MTEQSSPQGRQNSSGAKPLWLDLSHESSIRGLAVTESMNTSIVSKWSGSEPKVGHGETNDTDVDERVREADFNWFKKDFNFTNKHECK